MKPWTVLGSRRIFRNIRLDRCILPDQQEYEVPVLEFRDWVCVLALTPDQQVVLVRQYRHGLRQFILELPGGGMDVEDESPQHAACRELREETGFTSDRFIPLGSISPDPADHTNHMFPFLALDAVRSADQDLDATEEIEVLILPLDEVIAMARRGDLPQALHVSTLFLALAHLGRITSGSLT